MQPDNLNPFTGEKFHAEAVDTGVITVPHQSCWGRPDIDGMVRSGRTATFAIRDDQSMEAYKDMAKGLSEMTGSQIEFIDARTPATWGNIGFFLVRNPKLFTEGGDMASKRT